MPFALLIIGVFLLVSAVRGTHTQLFQLLQTDFTGQNNFVYWFVAIFIIGSLGYIEKLRPISIGLLTLIVLVLFISKGNPSTTGGGFFSQFTSAIGTGTA
jgi:hypothetical protein